MSDALKQLVSRTFACPESREISEYIQSVLARHPHSPNEENYVEYAASVPFYIESFWKAAQEKDQVALIQPILNNIKSYFLETEDMIPDRNGAIGLLDDAYMFYCSVDGLNARWKDTAGVPLVDIDLSGPMQMMAAHLGDDLANKIQTHVNISMHGDVAQSQLLSAGKYMLGGLAAMCAVNKLMSRGKPNTSEKWAELLNNRVDHGTAGRRTR